jgi:hypothetical protein
MLGRRIHFGGTSTGTLAEVLSEGYRYFGGSTGTLADYFYAVPWGGTLAVYGAK